VRAIIVLFIADSYSDIRSSAHVVDLPIAYGYREALGDHDEIPNVK